MRSIEATPRKGDMSRTKWSAAGLALIAALLVAGSTVVIAQGGIPGSDGMFTAC